MKLNVILLMVGANDLQLKIAPVMEAPARLRVLLDTIYGRPGVENPTVFVANVTPIRDAPGRPSGSAERVSAFNAAVPGIVTDYQERGRDIHFVDMFTPFDRAYATVMMADDLHPSAAGNELMARQWFRAIEARAMPGGDARPAAARGAPMSRGRD